MDRFSRFGLALPYRPSESASLSQRLTGERKFGYPTISSGGVITTGSVHVTTTVTPGVTVGAEIKGTVSTNANPKVTGVMATLKVNL